jgi:hypothetical protein
MSGVMQFVVQLEQEMMLGVPHGTFAPWTTVSLLRRVTPDRTTERAPAWMCFSRSLRRVYIPVHSNTRSTLSSLQGSSAGSRPLSVRTLRPSTTRSSPIDRDRLCVAPVNRVEPEQVCEACDLNQIVDRDQVERRVAGHQLEDCAADATQAVDGYHGTHAARLGLHAVGGPRSTSVSPYRSPSASVRLVQRGRGPGPRVALGVRPIPCPPYSLRALHSAPQQ